MYLAFHDEMADPESDDPVEKESTRFPTFRTQVLRHRHCAMTRLEVEYNANNATETDTHQYRA